MDCREAQEAILEMFEGSRPPDVGAHTAECAGCAAFLARQNALDRDLAGLFDAPELSAGFRSALRSRIAEDSPEVWPQALPDIVHVGSCLAATAVCAAVLPFGAGPVLAAGVLVTAATYVLALAARGWLDA